MSTKVEPEQKVVPRFLSGLLLHAGNTPGKELAAQFSKENIKLKCLIPPDMWFRDVGSSG